MHMIIGVHITGHDYFREEMSLWYKSHFSAPETPRSWSVKQTLLPAGEGILQTDVFKIGPSDSGDL